MIVALATGNVGGALLAAIATAVLVCYFLLLPWARKAIFAAIPFWAAGTALMLPTQDANQAAYVAGAGFGRALVLLLFVAAAYRSTRNKLAFKIEVSEAELVAYYERYVSNPQAKRALAYGVLSLFIPLLVPVVFVLGMRGMKRANKDAWPPVGYRGAAIAGLALSGLSTVLWLAVLASVLLRRA